MSNADGYAGDILRVDLTTRSVDRVPTRDIAELFIGGRGLAAKIYWDEVPPQTHAFDPENRIIFATGPVTASTQFAGSRWQVCGKSPIHNLFSYCNLGGTWGAQLKYAGYDALVVHGKADDLVTLYIDDDKVEIRDAKHLKATGAISCREELKQELGKSARVVAIGPAGENGVTFATFLADDDSSGSSGLAASLGSKNLKAIAVRGKGKVEVADPERVRQIRDRVRMLTEGLLVGEEPVVPPEGLKKDICFDCIGGCIRKKYQAQNGQTGKFMCGSSIYYSVRAQRYYGVTNEVPFEATKLIDEYGLDSYNVETMIMWLVRCYHNRVLTEEETGLPFSKIGSLEFIETLVRSIAHREGFGDVMARGVHKAAEAVGPKAQECITDYVSRTGYTLTVGGPRAYLTTGLFWAMEPRLPIQHINEIGGVTMRWAGREAGTHDNPVTSDVIRAVAKRFWGSELAADFSTYEGKALAGAKIQDREYAKESLIVCDFMFPITYSNNTQDHVGDPTLESRLFSAVTGKETNEQQLYEMGERVFNLQRAIHAREGHKGRKSDALEEFHFTTPLTVDYGIPDCKLPGKNGETFSRKGMVVDREQFENMKSEYYEIRGWDPHTGLQKRTRLQELNLGEMADTLEKEGLLA
jgi:aldehyde:ferredoxin oxidoreductase